MLPHLPLADSGGPPQGGPRTPHLALRSPQGGGSFLSFSLREKYRAQRGDEGSVDRCPPRPRKLGRSIHRKEALLVEGGHLLLEILGTLEILMDAGKT